MNAPKKMKMERLSPIPEISRQLMSTVCTTPSKTVSTLTKNEYTIEVASSPEVDSKLPSNNPSKLLKTRRQRGLDSKVYLKSKKVSRNVNSTPLSSLLSRKTAQRQQNRPPYCGKEDPHNSPYSPITNLLEPSPSAMVKDLLIAETPLHLAPQKSKETSQLDEVNVKLHAVLQPDKRPPCGSKYTPLSGIVTRKSSSHCRSFNDSLSFVDHKDKDSEDEDFETGDGDLVVSIEPFPSPAQLSKPPISASLSEMFTGPLVFSQVFKSTKNAKLDESIVHSKKVDLSSLETQRKPKRVLDFSSCSSKTAIGDGEMLGKARGNISEREDAVNQNQFKRERSNKESIVSESRPDYTITEKTDDGLCGFTQCSKSSTDFDFPLVKDSQGDNRIQNMTTPIKVPSPTVIVEDALANSPPLTGIDIPFVAISNVETSSDESYEEDEHIIHDDHDEKNVYLKTDTEVIDNQPESYPLNFNVTKKTIQCLESPAKSMKLFSEAVNIESPVSPNSNDLKNVEDTIDTTATTTTLEEDMVDESEDVRPRKRMKKGTQVEQAASIISRIKASQKLFEYEIKANLCPSLKKAQVSTPLVVCRKSIDDASTVVHICKPLKCYESNFNISPDVECALLICILANESSFHIPVGSIVLLHFPITVIRFCNSKVPYVLAGSKLVLQKPPELSDLAKRNISNGCLNLLISLPKMNFTDQLKPELSALSEKANMSIVKVLQTNIVKTVSDSALGQALVDELCLNLTIVHIARHYTNTTRLQMTVFCCDNNSQPCLIEFRTIHDVKRAKALSTLHILADGAQVETKGFVVVRQEAMSNKMKTVFIYSFNSCISSDVVYVLTPSENDWVIMSSGGSRTVRKTVRTIAEISNENPCCNRYLVKVSSLVVSEENVFVRDSSGESLKISYHNDFFKNRCLSHPLPFFLDGLYFQDKMLYSDEYTITRIVPIT